MALSMEDTSYRLVKSEVRDLTPELAEEFRNLDPSPTERELNPARIRHLKTKAEAGQLVTFHWSVARLGDKRLRMNGQHSSNMLCALNGHFPKGLKVHLDEYEVPNKASLALLFRQFDDRKSNRSPSDVASAYQGLYEELHEVPKGPAKMAVEGASWYDRNVEGLPAPTGDDQYVRFSNRPSGVKRFQAIHQLQCRCSSRALASLRTRHQGPSIMGFEDEVEQSFGRPCR